MATVDLTHLSTQEKKELADRIYASLGKEAEVNLQLELALHYRRCNDAADLAYDALEKGNATAGTAAVLTAATGVLKELARLETEIYNAERVKLLERAFLTALRESDNPEGCVKAFEREIAQVEL